MPDFRDNMTVEDWMDVFSKLYSKTDEDRTPEQLWIAVMAHCSSIGESIRRIDYLDLLHFAAHAFCWLCSYVNKCKQLKKDIFSFSSSLSGIVSLKYPLICGYCRESNCRCPPEKMDKVEDKAARYEELLKERQKISFTEFTIRQWLETFNKIYRGRIHISTLETLGFHFLEEVGEGAMAVRMLSQLKRITDDEKTGIDTAFFDKLSSVEGVVEMYSKYKKCKLNYTSKNPEVLQARIVNAKIHMIIEIADTFSWFCSILNKLNSISCENKFNLPSLEEELKDEYFDEKAEARCPTCKQKPCSCIFYS